MDGVIFFKFRHDNFVCDLVGIKILAAILCYQIENNISFIRVWNCALLASFFICKQLSKDSIFY